MHLRERVFRIFSGFQNPTWQPGAVSAGTKRQPKAVKGHTTEG